MSNVAMTPERRAYLKSLEAEKWVRGYVRKMAAWPAPRFVRESSSTAGLTRAAA